PAAPRPPFSTM
nr:Chain E, Polyadenylate-binding protein 1 [Homo sapiens]5LGQ_F Chain F, Polyadenylate-binding protein 1 [Homo sapiens]5LGQ_G Chain G, Polyadenylate-binding protein 1 [Homo sapiens]5LGQ_H Chain H, Polyadenylate-binding protein 1 [Homo sapiens]